MKPNHLRKRPHKLFGSIFKRAVKIFWPLSLKTLFAGSHYFKPL